MTRKYVDPTPKEIAERKAAIREENLRALRESDWPRAASKGRAAYRVPFRRGNDGKLMESQQ